MFMDFNGAFSFIMEIREDKYLFWELTHQFGIIMDFINKMPSLLSLIPFLVFNNSIAMETCIY